MRFVPAPNSLLIFHRFRFGWAGFFYPIQKDYLSHHDITNRQIQVLFQYKLSVMMRSLLFFPVLTLLVNLSYAQSPKIAVIGYYAGRNTALDSFETGKLTHIIFSFCHLKGNRLSVNNANDSAIIGHMVSLKAKSPGLKVILS